MIGILGPILGVAAKAGLAAVSGKGKGGVISAALDGAGDFFEASANETAKRYELETEALKTQRDTILSSNQVALKQLEHKSLFVSGGRPFLLWVIGVATVYHFLIFPMLAGGVEFYFGFPLYDAVWQELATLIAAGLGMGGLRSYEKKNGVASDSMKLKG